MSEANLWDDLSEVMDETDWHASRVESHATSAGIPDVDYCYHGDGHVELKFGTVLKMPRIRDTQVRWMVKRAAAGGKVLILTNIVTDEGHIYLWHPGKFALQLYGNPGYAYWFNNRINDKYWQLDPGETRLILKGERS
jgi:hypothetical protein